jgi:hypothetical protein
MRSRHVIVALSLMVVAAVAVAITLRPDRVDATDQPACAAGGTCMFVDAFPGATGLQEDHIIGPGEIGFSVDVYVQSPTSGELSAFQFILNFDASLLVASPPVLDPTLAALDLNNDSQPDWQCLPAPAADYDGNPATGDALLSCFSGAGFGPPGNLVKVGTVTFTYAVFDFIEHQSAFTLSNVAVGDIHGSSLLSNCVPQTAGGCYDASVAWNATPPPPTPTPTGSVVLTPPASPTPTAVPTLPPGAQPDCAPQLGSLTAHCMVVDADVNKPGAQAWVQLPSSTTSFDVDVVAHLDAPAQLAAFNFSLEYDASWLDASVPALDPALALADIDDDGQLDWQCLPGPFADWDGNPATGDALLSCFIADPDAMGDAPAGDMRLGRIRFTMNPPSPAGKFSALTLDFATIGDTNFIQITGCQPVVYELGGGCLNGAVTWANALPGDDDGDGIQNAQDNCDGVWNPGQQNNDGNRIVLPGKPFDDITAPNSDEAGDACDQDDDNDGLLDGSEGEMFCIGSGLLVVTSPFLPDTDGDRVLDGAECALGSNPADPNSKPANVECGPGGDADGDGIPDFREFCYFITEPSAADTDGDGCSDSKEIASVNADVQINVLDLMIVAGAAGPSFDPDYHPNFDATRNGAIDVIDLGFVARQAGGC